MENPNIKIMTPLDIDGMICLQATARIFYGVIMYQGLVKKDPQHLESAMNIIHAMPSCGDA